ncbi:MAG TPA: hypothetical protein VHL34_10190 [Rhizomicrobium sp.]|jgi:hypothetical protein|nr:hypothetical protein [Rhizomicrobium sp.]
MLLDDHVFVQEPSDLVRLLAYGDLAVIPEPSLGIFFVRPLNLRSRAGYTIGVSGAAVRKACDGGLIAPANRQNGQGKDNVYVLTARGHWHLAMDGRAAEATRPIVPLLQTRAKHDLEHRLIEAEACFRRGQACIDRQQRFIESQARAGLSTTRAQTLANTFGDIQNTFAKTFHALSQRVL